MPAKAVPAPPREGGTPSHASWFASGQHSALPIWDEAQIAAENWGASLVATSASAGGLADMLQEAGGKQGAGKPKTAAGGGGAGGGASTVTGAAGGSGPGAGGAGGGGGTGGSSEAHFEDAVSHACVTDFIRACRRDPGSDASTRPTTGEARVVSAEGADAVKEDEGVTWRRPVDVFRPFRPVVHRNATPFIHPYASPDALTPVEAKAEEERARPQSSAGVSLGNASAPHKKGGAAAAKGTNSEPVAVVTEGFHEQYPEAVTVLEDFVGDDNTRWTHCSSTESIRQYRALPALMQPYDGALVAGCAETPAEACGSRYSTALRHKLKQAEQLSALSEAPPFLMTALNSALVAVEQAQRYIPEGFYLWELVHPHAPGTCHPVYNPFGKYAVKLFVDGAYRKVVVDDRLPVDVLGRPLLSTTAQKELWPALLAKAVVKALGPATGVQALTTAPDLIVSALMGHWVPQYLSPRRGSVATMARLLLYERHLKKLEEVTDPLLPTAAQAAGKDGEAAGAGDEQQHVGKKEAIKGGTAQGGRRSSGSQPRRTSSASKTRGGTEAEKTAAADASGGLQPLAATEFCAPTVDEPIPDQQPMYVCGVRTVPPATPSSSAAPGGGGTISPTPVGSQLFTIHAIKPFRNTFALFLHTTPRAAVAGGVFEKEKDASDVSALLRWGKRLFHNNSGGGNALASCGAASISAGDYAYEPTVVDMLLMSPARGATVTSCWLTMEEFMTHMEQVVVWRVLEGRYANSTFVKGDAVFQQVNGAAGGAEGQTSSATAAAPTSTTAAPGKRAPSPARGDGAATPALADAANAGAASDAPATVSSSLWWRVQAAKAVEAMIVVASPTVTRASAAPRRVDLRHFHWDRAEPLNHVDSLSFTDGALRSTILRFRPGTHLLRVDVRDMQAADKICFLSDASMDVKLTEMHDVEHDGFASVTDAGSYPAVAMHEVEYMWLKRVFTLTAPTCMTLILSTLPTGEDVALHRRLQTATNKTPAAAPAGKNGNAKGGGGGPGGGGAANARGGGGGGGGAAVHGPGSSVNSTNATVPAAGAVRGNGDSQRSREASLTASQEAAATAHDAEMPHAILRFTSLVLVNLDHPDDFRVGTAGRLVQLRLEPNTKGYLIVAFTRVPKAALPDVAGGDQDALPHIAPFAGDEDDADCEPEPSSVAGVVAVGGGAGAGAAAGAASVAGDSASVSIVPPHSTLSPAEHAVFPSGLWKLTLRSDAELNSFDAVGHNAHEVTVDADLPRGSSPVLFRRACAVSETTHMSLLAQLHSPFPVSYTVRITRVGAPSRESLSINAPKTSGGAAARAASSTRGAASAADAVPDASETNSHNATLVYESEPTQHHLFVADVLLPCTVESSPKPGKATGGGGGAGGGGAGGGGSAAAPTVYIIEAFVADADAAAWEEHCRRHQEDVFSKVRRSAELRATAGVQQAIRAFEQDPDGFLQRKREAESVRHQHSADSAEKSSTQAGGGAGGGSGGSATATAGNASSRKRSSGGGRRSSRRLSAALESTNKDFSRRPSSSSTPTELANDMTALAQLDTVDPARLVHLTAQLSFSSTRADVKVESAPVDPVVELRQHMKETMAWLHERTGAAAIAAAAAAAPVPTGGRGGGGPGAGQSSSGAQPGTSSGKAPAPRNQREAAANAASAEDALHAEAARQSRLNYLRNPQHLFRPSFSASDVHDDFSGASAAAASATNGNISAGAYATSPPAIPHKARQHDSNNNSGGGAAANSAGTSTRGGRKESTQARLSSITSEDVPSPGIAASNAARAAADVMLHDGAATHFRYSAPLTPLQYHVELLPLRTFEECPCSNTAGRDKDGAAQAAPSGSGGGKRPKSSSSSPSAAAAALGKGPGAASSGTGGSVGVGAAAGMAGGAAAGLGSGASTLSCPLTAAECEAVVMPLQAPLLDAIKDWETIRSGAARTVAKAPHNVQFFNNYTAYFEAIAAQRAAVTSAINSTDGGEPVQRPVVYHSLLGNKEEEQGPSARSRKTVTGA